MAIKNTLFMLAVMLLAVPGVLCAQEKMASKGSVTEALFILQNKQRELQEYIQKLKTQLTDCFAQKKLLECEECGCKGANTKEWEISQCDFTQKIFPGYIKELELLAERSMTAIGECSKDESIKADRLKKEVDYAFLIKEKIALETVLIDLVRECDKNEWELKNKQKQLEQKRTRISTVVQLKRDIVYLKKRIKAKKMALAKINKEISKGLISGEKLFTCGQALLECCN